MKLNLDMLHADIQELGDTVRLGVWEKTPQLEMPVFFRPGQRLEPHRLYVVNAGDMERLPADFPQGSAILRAGAAEGRREPPLPGIAVAGADVFALLYAAQVVFQKYANWDAQLMRLVIEERDLQEFIACSAGILSNPPTVMDREYRIITKPLFTAAAFERFGMEPPDENGFMQLRHVRDFKDSDAYTGLYRLRGAFRETGDDLPCSRLSHNLFYRDEYIARVIMMNLNEPLRPIDYMLMEHLARYLERAYIRVYLEQSALSELGEALKHALSQEGDASAAPYLKGGDGGGVPKRYRWVKLLLTAKDMQNDTAPYTCKIFEARFPGSTAFPFNGGIAAFLDAGRWRDPEQSLRNTLASFVEEGGYKAGVSGEFTGESRLRLYFEQAKAALELGAALHPQGSVYQFSDYAVAYLLEAGCAAMPRDIWISPAIQALQQHDREKATEYVHTLRVYLDHAGAIVSAARALYIHRSTMQYRLDKIAEIGHIDLKDREQMLYLTLSYRMLDR